MRRVWLVDDDEEMNRAIGLMLKMLDCEVTSFYNARSAAQTLLTGKTPQVMILDLNMPEISGLDLLEFLRRRAEWRHLPVVVLSSESADSAVDQAITLGADAYIMKPATIEELENAMTTALQKHLSME